MKKLVLLCVFLIAVVFLLPFVSPVPRMAADEPPPSPSAPTSPDAQVAAAETEAEAAAVFSPVGGDSDQSVTLLYKGVVYELSMFDYLTQVVAAEMPVSFEPEALKAQAVCARTYALYRMGKSNEAHPEARLCGDSAHCSAFLSIDELREKWGGSYEESIDNIRAAVAATDSSVLLYSGGIIDAVYHSTSSGMTESAIDVWGAQIPYLTSVKSEGESSSPRYSGTVSLPVSQLREKLKEALPDASLSEEPMDWFTDIERSEAGGVVTLNVGGAVVRGSFIRALLGLMSTNYEISFDGESVVFHTIGYGHGVGMSQYGANAMAQEGKSWEDIVLWYYSGSEIRELSEEEYSMLAAPVS